MNAFFETTNGFNFQIINPLIESRGVRLTWFDCKCRLQTEYKKQTETKTASSTNTAVCSLHFILTGQGVCGARLI